jgi:hypothetical protein
MTGICRENRRASVLRPKESGAEKEIKGGSSVGVENGRDERERDDSGVTSLVGYENGEGRRAASRSYPGSILRSSPVLVADLLFFPLDRRQGGLPSFLRGAQRKMKGSNQ